jgi:hypothetical protein
MLNILSIKNMHQAEFFKIDGNACARIRAALSQMNQEDLRISLGKLITFYYKRVQYYSKIEKQGESLAAHLEIHQMYHIQELNNNSLSILIIKSEQWLRKLMEIDQAIN